MSCSLYYSSYSSMLIAAYYLCRIFLCKYSLYFANSQINLGKSSKTYKNMSRCQAREDMRNTSVEHDRCVGMTRKKHRKNTRKASDFHEELAEGLLIFLVICHEDSSQSSCPLPPFVVMFCVYIAVLQQKGVLKNFSGERLFLTATSPSCNLGNLPRACHLSQPQKTVRCGTFGGK